MPTLDTHITHLIGGGWATSFGPSAFVPLDGDTIQVPFLWDAENLKYTLDGGTTKDGGTETVNQAVIVDSTTVVKGGFEYVRFGTSGSVSRKRVVYAGTTVVHDDADGDFSNSLFTGLESGKVPNFTQFDDLMIFSTDSETDVPKSWDGTTAQDLAGNPPNFSFSEVHINRLWSAGVRSRPSRLYYSANLDPEVWDGTGAGHIDIDPDDGDEIMAIISWNTELWVFKGPNKGSIHRISGTSPVDFSRHNFAQGVGAAGPNVVWQYANDVGFMWSDGTVHSLRAVEQFGDARQGSLSLPIDTWIRERVNKGRLKHASAAVLTRLGLVHITLATDSSTNNNHHLFYDYRFSPVRWSHGASYTSGCVFTVVDVQDNNNRAIFSGGNDGNIRRTNLETKAIDGSDAINYKMTFPYLNYGLPNFFKAIYAGHLGISPGGSYNVTYRWTRDDNSQQSQTVTQGGGDVLAVDQTPTPSTGAFTLGTSTLGGALFIDRFMELEEGGSFRQIQFEVVQTTAFQECEVHTLGARIRAESDSSEN